MKKSEVEVGQVYRAKVHQAVQSGIRKLTALKGWLDDATEDDLVERRTNGWGDGIPTLHDAD